MLSDFSDFFYYLIALDSKMLLCMFYEAIRLVHIKLDASFFHFMD